MKTCEGINKIQFRTKRGEWKEHEQLTPLVWYEGEDKGEEEEIHQFQNFRINNPNSD